METNSFGFQNLWDRDVPFKRLVQSIYVRTKSVQEFLTASALSISSIVTTQHATSSSTNSRLDHLLSPPDSKLSILPHLSELEISLLIAAARLDVILDTDTSNFNMAYDEYTSLASKSKIQASSAVVSSTVNNSSHHVRPSTAINGHVSSRHHSGINTMTGSSSSGLGFRIWGKETSLTAWEKLVRYELLVPTTIGGTSSSIFNADATAGVNSIGHGTGGAMGSGRVGAGGGEERR